MKIVADENIPQVKEAFDKFGEVILMPGRKICAWFVRDADVLLVRSVTNVNEELLSGSKVKFAATATIGTDHIDLEYLNKNNIGFANAAGCNAYSVAEYVVCAITKIFFERGIQFSGKRFGVIGFGNIGKKISLFARALGFEVLINDPPLEREGIKENFSPLAEVLAADVITLHVPLTTTGIDKTFRLIDEEKLNLLKPGSFLINTSRGAVIDNRALLKRLEQKKDLLVVLDVWENEPDIDRRLLNTVEIGTAHIAGYSFEGKINSTLFILEKFCAHFNFTLPSWKPLYPLIQNDLIDVEPPYSIEEMLYKITTSIYNIGNDSRALKNGLALADGQLPVYFDELRKNYPVRREFNNYTVKLGRCGAKAAGILENLRLKTIYY